MSTITSAKMKLTVLISLIALGAFAAAAPTSSEDGGKVEVTKEFFPDELAIHTAEDEIVSLYLPLNKLNFDDDADDDDDEGTGEDSNSILFYATAEFNDKGERIDKGLYSYKGGVSTKILDNGRDSSADNGDDKVVYFGAKDGLYVYNAEKNAAEKYGTVTDSVLQVAKVNGSDVIYILTDDHQVYKVTEEGKTKTKVEAASGAREIVIDFSNNLYFYGEDLKPQAVDSEGTAKVITGLPEGPTYVKLVRPAFIFEDSVLFISNDQLYAIYANGTSEITDFIIKEKPSAYAMDATLIQYYAYNKKIYEYNILSLLFSGLLSELKDVLEDKKDEIQAIATRSRSDLRP